MACIPAINATLNLFNTPTSWLVWSDPDNNFSTIGAPLYWELQLKNNTYLTFIRIYYTLMWNIPSLVICSFAITFFYIYLLHQFFHKLLVSFEESVILSKLANVLLQLLCCCVIKCLDPSMAEAVCNAHPLFVPSI